MIINRNSFLLTTLPLHTSHSLHITTHHPQTSHSLPLSLSPPSLFTPHTLSHSLSPSHHSPSADLTLSISLSPFTGHSPSAHLTLSPLASPPHLTRLLLIGNDSCPTPTVTILIDVALRQYAGKARLHVGTFRLIVGTAARIVCENDNILQECECVHVCVRTCAWVLCTYDMIMYVCVIELGQYIDFAIYRPSMYPISISIRLI